MLTSIIVTTYNRCDLLYFGLLSILKQDCKYPYEIIVINDYLPDDTENLVNNLSKQFPNICIKYYFTGQRNIASLLWRCPSFAINFGVKKCRGQNIIISCAEIFHIGNTLESIIENLLKQDCLSITNGFDDKGKILEQLKNKGKIDLPLDSKNYNALNTKLPFCLGLPKDVFIKIGGYDEDFIGQAYDDNDIVTRLQKFGLQYIKANVDIIHLYHSRQLDTRSPKRVSFNKHLFESRKTIVRNEGKEWGNG